MESEIETIYNYYTEILDNLKSIKKRIVDRMKYEDDLNIRMLLSESLVFVSSAQEDMVDSELGKLENFI